MSQTALTILFSSLHEVDPTFTNDQTPERLALFNRCMERLVACIPAYDGVLIKTLPKRKAMWTFPTAQQAIESACAMMDTLAYEPLAFSGGMHHGPVIAEDNDVFGESVNLAARVADLAKPFEILTTRPTVNALPLFLAQERTRFIDRLILKGMEEKQDIFQVIPEDKDATLSGAELIRVSDDLQEELEIRFGDQVFNLQPGSPNLTVGREPQNDIIFADDPLCSRKEHVSIGFVGKTFILTDRSTNGTYILTDDGEEVFLHRESFVLNGEGRIIPGRNHAPADRIIHFFVRRG